MSHEVCPRLWNYSLFVEGDRLLSVSSGTNTEYAYNYLINDLYVCYSLFEEILHWIKQPKLRMQLFSALPEGLQEIPLIAMGDLSLAGLHGNSMDLTGNSIGYVYDDQAMLLSPIKQPVAPAPSSLGLGGFVYLIAATAIQVQLCQLAIPE
jgi:hypothetical protein